MHLHWATHAENSQDARDKRREYIGEANSNAVLDDAKVVTIRRMQSRGCRLKDIAEVVGCSTSNVSKVARRELWIHVHA
jgi:antitoxin component HigA of HigAB toxin-antitoxin module